MFAATAEASIGKVRRRHNRLSGGPGFASRIYSKCRKCPKSISGNLMKICKSWTISLEKGKLILALINL